ncbi:hypothetical protein F5878DRAFT_667850 [Lentinula raphanica]|uniref:Uncharacterized protein n=1 Tax=Lentinula raphanica TaxID=153919 RepID=A0AA38NV25_9AGAR|nr:hypothetical protein F5878DRAFT_667850 [Lentinula raphanica]
MRLQRALDPSSSTTISRMLSYFTQSKTACKPTYFMTSIKGRQQFQYYVVLGGKSPGIYANKKAAYAQASDDNLPEPQGFDVYADALETWRIFCVGTHIHTASDVTAPALAYDKLSTQPTVEKKKFPDSEVNEEAFMTDRELEIARGRGLKMRARSESPHKADKVSTSSKPSKSNVRPSPTKGKSPFIPKVEYSYEDSISACTPSAITLSDASPSTAVSTGYRCFVVRQKGSYTIYSEK